MLRKIFQILVKLLVWIDHMLLDIFYFQKQLLFLECRNYFSECCVITQQQTTPSCKQYSLDRVLDFVQMKALITQRNNSIYECEFKLLKKSRNLIWKQILHFRVLHKFRLITKCFQSGGIADKPVPSNQTRVPELPHALFKLWTSIYVKKMLLT